eukprot:TRINITY_DN9161_c0_g1_i1.p1 TRINITY_DN9161_c0_g1~~TRINITY_DN9161_c0_g1_i1.p1  ORF type:complete len:576 (-),score=118.11 TRINITY_DN9161_c0_g1_i1:217-1944(-)
MSQAIDSGQGPGSSSFKTLLQALSEQYERDILEAGRQVRAEHSKQDAQPHAPEGKASDESTPAVRKTSKVQPADPSDDSLRCAAAAWNEQLDKQAESPATESIPNSVNDSSGSPSVLPDAGNTRKESNASSTAASASSGESLRERVRRSSVTSKEGDGTKLIQKEALRSIPEPTTAIGRFVTSSAFDQMSASLLLANAVFIGVQIEYGFQAVTPVAIDAIDYVFTVLFLVELVLRLYGYGCSHFWCDLQDRAWNAFDFSIVVLSTLDTVISAILSGQNSPFPNISVLRVIRVLRIVRVLRVIRVMKFFRDLRILLSAIVSTMKTASFALSLIVFIMYLFGIAITQLVADFVREQQLGGSSIAMEEEIYKDLVFFFGGIFRSIFTLFMTIAGGIDWKDAAVPLFEVGELAIIFFLVYVALMILCVMNVLLGIFCQCALETAASDKENVIQLQLQEKSKFVDTLKTLFAGWDDSGDGRCSLEEFENHLQDETTQALLSSLEIESRDAVMLFELLDTDGSGEVDLNEFVTGCITLRGGAKAVHMEKINAMNKLFTDRFQHIEAQMDKLVNKDQKHDVV